MWKATGPTPFYVHVRKMNLQIYPRSHCSHFWFKGQWILLWKSHVSGLARIRVWTFSFLRKRKLEVILCICPPFPLLIHKTILGFYAFPCHWAPMLEGPAHRVEGRWAWVWLQALPPGFFLIETNFVLTRTYFQKKHPDYQCPAQ